MELKKRKDVMKRTNFYTSVNGQENFMDHAFEEPQVIDLLMEELANMDPRQAQQDSHFIALSENVKPYQEENGRMPFMESRKGKYSRRRAA